MPVILPIIIVLCSFLFPSKSEASYSDVKSTVLFDHLSDSLYPQDMTHSLRLIKDAGFNTVSLHMSWNNFQKTLNSEIDQKAFDQIRDLLSILRANNLQALFFINSNVPPEGVDHYYWIDHPEQFNLFKKYFETFLIKTQDYSDIMYINLISENSYPFDVIKANPQSAATKLRTTVGNLPNMIDPTLRSKFKIGYHDFIFVPLFLINSSNNLPVASIDTFDFYSISVYPQFPEQTYDVSNLSSFPDQLNRRVTLIKSLYPNKPIIFSEVGFPSCDSMGGAQKQSQIITKIINYSLQNQIGFNIWSFLGGMGGNQMALECSDKDLGIYDPFQNGQAKSTYFDIKQILNPSDIKTIVNQPFAPKDDSSAFQSIELSNYRFYPGQKFMAKISFKNTGTKPWTANNLYRLGVRVPLDGKEFGEHRYMIPNGESISPGQTKTFNIQLQAPNKTGEYFLGFRMVHDGVNWFGESTPVQTLVVGNYLSGDINTNGRVDIFDYNILVSSFGNPYTIFDYNTLVANFGKSI